MSIVTVTNNSRSEIYDWNYRMNRLNDQIAERRFRGDDGFHGPEGSSPQRVNSGSRNLGYYDDEEREVSNRRSFGMSDDTEQRYQRNRGPHNAGNRGHFVERSRMYQMPDDEDRSNGRSHNQEMEGKGYRQTKSHGEIRNDRHHYQEIDETGYRDSEFRQKRRDSHNQYLVMDEAGHRKTEFCNGKAINRNGIAYQESLEMRYMDRGLLYPETTQYYPAPNAQYIDRGSGIQQSNMQYQPGSSAWNTQVPFSVQNPPVERPDDQEEKEEKKPRKVWFYTTSRVFSALLIISSLVSDWLEYSDMDAPNGVAKETNKTSTRSEACSDKSREDITKQFLYFTIAGTVLAALQLANIIYQIVENHRSLPDKEIRDWLDERTEVFLVNAFVEFPQIFLIHRYEAYLCLDNTCELDIKKVRRILNGFSSLASTVWRYLTHVKVSAGSSCSCSNMCKRCAACCGNCIKSCLWSCIKCICPCCCWCIDCKTFFPCCCLYVSCKNSRMSTKCACQCEKKSPSIFAVSAVYPTTLVAFLYGLRVWKYICLMSSLSEVVVTFVFDTAIGYVWDTLSSIINNLL
ncbi:uncharacterized protein [Magallana gigas]|uniref:uncharacterized protein n=1 Tax=Magallana gigas TaxID=29159 RepID=UPI00333F16B1